MPLRSKHPRRVTYIGLGWALHRGRIDDADLHAHDALQISLAGTNERFVDLGDATLWASTILILRGAQHAVRNMSGTPWTLFVDPDSELATGLITVAKGRNVVVLKGQIERAARSCVRDMQADSAHAQQFFDKFGMLFGTTKTGRPSDPRIDAALVALREDHHRPWPLVRLAKIAGLSNGRFADLIKRCTGLPLRAHVRWLRFQTAIDALSQGADLASAATAAGYSSADQLTYAFRRVFGLSPPAFASPRRRRA